MSKEKTAAFSITKSWPDVTHTGVEPFEARKARAWFEGRDYTVDDYFKYLAEHEKNSSSGR